jgi:hypothetical protein
MAQEGKLKDVSATAGRRKHSNIFDRLQDTSLYTGIHRHRFDENGKGLGMEGRDSTAGHFGHHGCIQGLSFARWKVTKKPCTYTGRTSSGAHPSQEERVFRDPAEYLMRHDNHPEGTFIAGEWNYDTRLRQSS